VSSARGQQLERPLPGLEELEQGWSAGCEPAPVRASCHPSYRELSGQGLAALGPGRGAAPPLGGWEPGGQLS
jgi:hypothetical protein